MFIKEGLKLILHYDHVCISCIIASLFLNLIVCDSTYCREDPNDRDDDNKLDNCKGVITVLGYVCKVDTR